MTRRSFAFALALSLSVAVTHALAEQTTRIPIVGYLFLAASQNDPLVMAWRQGLRDLGYVDGQNIKLEFRSAQGQPERLPGLAEDLLKVNPDVLFASNDVAAQALRRATSTVPIVIALTDPVPQGLATNLAHPGGNITGLSSMTTELHGKRLQLLKETIPGLAQVTVLWNPTTPPEPVHLKFVEDLNAAARSLSVELKFVVAHSPEEFESAFSTINRTHAQALYLQGGPLYYVHRIKLVKLALKARLPTVFGIRAFADEGGLMSYGVNFADQLRRSTTYIDKILKGAKPGDLPIEQPTKLELVINLKTAKALDLSIPESILLRADEVIR